MIPVIFRKFKDGQVIALFPLFTGTLDPATCGDYMRVGQHGTCDLRKVVSTTVLATVKEYSSLLKELISIGYEDLAVRSRVPSDAYSYRRDCINKVRRGTL